MLKTKEVLAVVVTYNRLTMLKQCMQHLLDLDDKVDVLVINNASTDGTTEYLDELAKAVSHLSVCNLTTNIGGAGGFSRGMREACEQGYKAVWIMDDDCFVKHNTLTELISAHNILGGNYGWLSSVALWTDGQECKMNRQKLRKDFYEYSPLLKEGLVKAEQATFVSLFVPCDVVYNVGLPIEEFFIWGDDIEFTRRVTIRYSLPSFVVGKSQVIHAMTNNDGSDISRDQIERIPRYFYAYRNECYLYRKEGIRGIAYYLAKLAYHCLKVLGNSHNFRIRRLGIIVKGVIRGIGFNPSVKFPK